MLTSLRNWLQRNAYGIFLQRVLVAVGLAAVSVLLSFLPYDTILQAVWVVISSSFMAWVVLRKRLNESDNLRYRRLFNDRFSFLEGSDPEALTTVFAENLRPRVLDWIRNETGMPVRNARNIDALDSLAKNGDTPGQLIFRVGVWFGRWLESCEPPTDKLKQLEGELDEFITGNRDLLGVEVQRGVFLRHVRKGDSRPVGIHMFHPDSYVLLTVEHYEIAENEIPRHSLALSFKSALFDKVDEDEWTLVRDQIRELFPRFHPAQGGSGPQKKSIPFFVGPVDECPVVGDEELKSQLTETCAALPIDLPEETEPNETTESKNAASVAE